MKISSKNLPPAILKALEEPDPIGGEDIVIENDKGKVLGAILTAKAYAFFLKKIGEAEDEMDSSPSISEPYDPKAKSLEQIKREKK